MKAKLVFGMAGVLVALVLSAAGGGAGTAFAACRAVEPAEVSMWPTSACGPTLFLFFGQFVRTVAGSEKHVASGDCAKVEPGEPSGWEDSSCTKKHEGTGEYALLAFLPEFSVETKFTGTSGKGKLNLTGAEIKCESGTSEGTPSSHHLGKFTIDFKSCALGGKECHSEGDAEGVILVKGEYHLVRLGEEKAGVWFLVEPVKISCKFLSTKTEVKGNVLGLIEPVNTAGTKFTINVNVHESKQEWAEYENNEGVKEKAELLGSVNGGAFKAATEESSENKITTEKETSVDAS